MSETTSFMQVLTVDNFGINGDSHEFDDAELGKGDQAAINYVYYVI
jgi:hypothetical protein